MKTAFFTADTGLVDPITGPIAMISAQNTHHFDTMLTGRPQSDCNYSLLPITGLFNCDHRPDKRYAEFTTLFIMTLTLGPENGSNCFFLPLTQASFIAIGGEERILF